LPLLDAVKSNGYGARDPIPGRMTDPGRSGIELDRDSVSSRASNCAFEEVGDASDE
jgi:hypothetical protein